MTGVPTAFPIPRRALLRLAALAAANRVAGFEGTGDEPADEHKVVLLTIGGIRRQESFSREGTANIPHLYKHMAPQALFYPYVMNDGVTAHVNSISSIEGNVVSTNYIVMGRIKEDTTSSDTI